MQSEYYEMKSNKQHKAVRTDRMFRMRVVKSKKVYNRKKMKKL